MRKTFKAFARATLDVIDALPTIIFPRRKLESLSKGIYNYHNLGQGIFPTGEEKTPYGSGERYNFDRMYMMVSNYDFTNKSLIDLGCNSGWFSIQAKLLGTSHTIGVDYIRKDMKKDMLPALKYAIQFEQVFKLGIHFVNADLEQINFDKLANRYGVKQFDVALLLSVLHHIWEHDMEKKALFFAELCNTVKDVIFYEDHEFWNDLGCDEDGRPIAVKGEGYRFGWNEDLSWQRKIHAIEHYEPQILDYYSQTWRKDVLKFDQFTRVNFLGFSEKRRPVFAFFK